MASEASGPDRGSVVALLVLVVGLAAATVWFVALPLLDRPPTVARTCEVYVLPSGTTKCVPTPKSGKATAKGAKTKPARRATP